MQRSALCRSRRELSNAYLPAKFGFDTAENEPCKIARSPRTDPPGGLQKRSRRHPPKEIKKEIKMFPKKLTKKLMKTSEDSNIYKIYRVSAAESFGL